MRVWRSAGERKVKWSDKGWAVQGTGPGWNSTFAGVAKAGRAVNGVGGQGRVGLGTSWGVSGGGGVEVGGKTEEADPVLLLSCWGKGEGGKAIGELRRRCVPLGEDSQTHFAPLPSPDSGFTAPAPPPSAAKPKRSGGQRG